MRSRWWFVATAEIGDGVKLRKMIQLSQVTIPKVSPDILEVPSRSVPAQTWKSLDGERGRGVLFLR